MGTASAIGRLTCAEPETFGLTSAANDAPPAFTAFVKSSRFVGPAIASDAWAVIVPVPLLRSSYTAARSAAPYIWLAVPVTLAWSVMFSMKMCLCNESPESVCP
jgi:hypothetical protein